MRWRSILCAFSGAAIGAAALGESPSTDQLVEQLREQVAELRAEVQTLKAADGESWLTEQRAREIRALVQDVLADADTRASLLQVRFAWNHADDQGLVGAPDNIYGFEVRRAKLKLDGHVIDPSWQYVLNLSNDHDSPSNELDLEDAFIRKSLENGIRLWAGQFKTEFNREELTSSSYQLAADRSVVNELFNLDRSQGFMVEYAGDRFRLFGEYSNGAGQRATGFDILTANFANAFTARVDWLAAGDWGQFKDFQGWKGQEYGAMFGAAVSWQQSKYGSDINALGTPRTTRLSWTIDGQVEGDGWSLFAYVVGNHLSDNAAGSTSADQIGIVVQGSWMFHDDWDVYARYEWADLDGNASTGTIDAVAGLPNVSILTVGVNRYFSKNSAKWTTDIGYGFDPVPDTASNSGVTGVGWRPDVPGQDGQFVLRSQVQLLF